VNLIWTNLKVAVGQDEAELPYILSKRMKISPENILCWRILRRSVDARKKPEIFYVYTIEFSLAIPPKNMGRFLALYPQLKEKPEIWENHILARPEKKLSSRPVVVGSGPAGYFAALKLAENGYRPLVLERGDKVEDRSRIVERFWQNGELDPESNVQFGEGGAGTFSDGKLTTRIDDRRVRNVLEMFAELGSNPEILFAAKPHIGTDVLRTVVAGFRKRIESLGGEIIFRARVTGLKTVNGRLEGVEVNHKDTVLAETVILAVGNSARDVYGFLKKMGVILEAKPFAVGLRVEHKQELINLAQYGASEHPLLGPADYQLSYKDLASGRGVYSFCMCPGGQVIASSSEEGGVVTNGMSNSSRDSGTANSAIVVTVGRRDFESDDCLAGADFQQKLESRAYVAGGRNYNVPAQSVIDFLDGRITGRFDPVPTYRPEYCAVDLQTVLPTEIGDVLKRALKFFDRKIQGFAGKEATLCGIESRTSAPVRITRDESGQSPNLKGLFPAGEGSGYSGGITSSAVDGLKAAEKLMAIYTPAGS